jgi:hypothetical protein
MEDMCYERDNRILAINVLVSLWGAAAPAEVASAGLDRTVLPIPEPRRATYAELDVRKATPPPHFEPTSVNGVAQRPMDGTSMLYSFNDGKAKERHTTQYFEMFGNRAIYDDGWLARTIHRAPWESTPRRPLAEDIWELYDTRSDFSLSQDLPAKYPERLAEVLFMSEAQRNHALPIDDRVFERLIATQVGRPDLMGAAPH